MYKGVETLSGIKTNEIILIFLAIGLILIGIFEIISAVGVYLKRKCWLLGIFITVLFAIDGAINGYFLLGNPGDQGTVVNLIAAVIIITLLLFGKKSVYNNN